MKIEQFLQDNPYTAALLRVTLPVLAAGIFLVLAAYIHRPRTQRFVEVRGGGSLDTDTGIIYEDCYDSKTKLY